MTSTEESVYICAGPAIFQIFAVLGVHMAWEADVCMHLLVSHKKYLVMQHPHTQILVAKSNSLSPPNERWRSVEWRQRPASGGDAMTVKDIESAAVEA